MDNTLKIRQKSFDKLLNRGQRKNEKNWEMLCSSQFPLVPFIGAGMSAWCYKTWSRLLKDIVAENYSAMCADIVDKALNCTENLILKMPLIKAIFIGWKKSQNAFLMIMKKIIKRMLKNLS